MRFDIYLKSNNGLNCLHIAAMYGHLDLCKILINKHNFDVHMATNDDSLPFHFSVQSGNFVFF